MRQHLRVDAIKVFEEDDQRLKRIMRRENIKTKTAAYRHALETYDLYHELPDAMRLLKQDVEAKIDANNKKIFILLEQVLEELDGIRNYQDAFLAEEQS